MPDVRDPAEEVLRKLEMTKQNKFKKRVRAQMEETGKRYTETHADLHGVPLKEAPADVHGVPNEGLFEKTLDRLLECRRPHPVERIALDFHCRYFGNTPGSESLALHLLEVLMPKHASWVNGQERPDPSARSATARDDLRELLTQYRGASLGVEEGKIFHTNFSKESGWLGTRTREEYQAIYRDLKPDKDGFEFAPQGALPRHSPLTPEEEKDLSGLWEKAPDVSKEFGGDPVFYGSGSEPAPLKKAISQRKTPLNRDPAAMGEILRLRQMLEKRGIDPDEE